jgi:nitrous oxidase accessory protein NosD
MPRTARHAFTLAVTLFCFIAVTASAGAATIYVSASSPVVAGGKSCAQPDASTVQAGIAAAKGGTVDVCAGTYTEQIAITEPVKLTAVSGINTATLEMPAAAVDSTTACDTQEGLQQKDEISICTGGKVSITGLDVKALIPLETCAEGLNGIFIGGGGTLKATSITVDGASTTLNAYKGCQHGVAIAVGSKTPAEVGHASLKNVTVTGYQKNGPTVRGKGSTMAISGSTITGEGPSPYIGQNGIEVAFGGKATIKSTSVSGNECSLPGICGAEGEQASGVLFYEAAPGSSVSGSTVSENDLGVYYSSGSKTLPSAPEVSIAKDVLTSNRYEGVELEEGKASLKTLTINGSGRVGIDLYQADYQESASESVATAVKISGQSEAAIKVESDKQPGDIAGKFLITKSTETANGSLLINDSNNFEVIF